MLHVPSSVGKAPKSGQITLITTGYSARWAYARRSWVRHWLLRTVGLRSPLLGCYSLLATVGLRSPLLDSPLATRYLSFAIRWQSGHPTRRPYCPASCLSDISGYHKRKANGLVLRNGVYGHAECSRSILAQTRLVGLE